MTSKTNAERQAAYRARHLDDEAAKGARLNFIIDLHAKRALERLASYYGVTQRAMLERLLAAAEWGAVLQASAQPGGEADYYEKRLRAAPVDVTQ